MKTVDTLNALAAGCDVWVVSNLDKSSWARRIDWYLNSQIMRSEPHQMPVIGPELQRVLESAEMEMPEIEAGRSAPLMVASSGLLPNNKTVVVPFASSTDEWVKKCHQVWQSLGCPRIRIFLPELVGTVAFETAWPPADRNAQVEFVESGPTI